MSLDEWHNPMYEFQDTVKREGPLRTHIPTSAMVYDNQLIEEIIPGYKTVKVEGREMISVEMEEQNTRFGSIVTSQRVTSRTLKITYKIEEKDPRIFQQRFNELMMLLYKEEDVSISFIDEAQHFYYGRYSSGDNPDGADYSTMLTLNLLCSNPFKYTEVMKTNGEIYPTHCLRNDIYQIEITPLKSEDILITNGREVITIKKGAFSPGSSVVIDMKTKRKKILVNGQNKSSYLDLKSDFSNFTLKDNDSVTCSNGDMTIQYRGVML